jgi:hypothetical protein
MGDFFVNRANYIAERNQRIRGEHPYTDPNLNPRLFFDGVDDTPRSLPTDMRDIFKIIPADVAFKCGKYLGGISLIRLVDVYSPDSMDDKKMYEVLVLDGNGSRQLADKIVITTKPKEERSVDEYADQLNPNFDSTEETIDEYEHVVLEAVKQLVIKERVAGATING